MLDIGNFRHIILRFISRTKKNLLTAKNKPPFYEEHWPMINYFSKANNLNFILVLKLWPLHNRFPSEICKNDLKLLLDPEIKTSNC